MSFAFDTEAMAREQARIMAVTTWQPQEIYRHVHGFGARMFHTWTIRSSYLIWPLATGSYVTTIDPPGPGERPAPPRQGSLW